MNLFRWWKLRCKRKAAERLAVVPSWWEPIVLAPPPQVRARQTWKAPQVCETVANKSQRIQ